MMKWISIAFWLIVIAVVGWASWDRLPPQHNPFTELAIDHPLGLATSLKVSKFTSDPDACFQYLDTSRIEYTQLENDEPAQNCGFYDALTLDRSALPYNATLRMTCPLTAALSLWERQALVIRAQQYFDAPPVKVLTFGSYSCRRMYGRSSGKFSEHATGNAIDIQGIEFADGSRIILKDDWGTDTPEGRFLEDLRNDSCRIFGTVLGPEYNAAHADHFHLDMSQTGVCS